jgi:hypothetical protein
VRDSGEKRIRMREGVIARTDYGDMLSLDCDIESERRQKK